MYSAYITKIQGLKKHPNADRLMVGKCLNCSVIVSNDTDPDALGVYFPTDGQIGVQFAQANNLLRNYDANNKNIGGFLDPVKRNIITLKIRGVISDGLFLPLESLSSFTDIAKLKEGDRIDTINGVVICQKYIPGAGKTVSNESKTKQKRKAPRIVYPYFAEHTDTQNLELSIKGIDFQPDELLVITEKLHGTSQRSAYTTSLSVEAPFCGIPVLESIGQYLVRCGAARSRLVRSMSYACGTRRNIVTDSYTGFFGSENFRRKWHERIKARLYPGEEVFYEVVGYNDNGSPLMGRYDTKSLSESSQNRFGKQVVFSYGCTTDICCPECNKPSQAYIYRMTWTSPDGDVVEYPTSLVRARCQYIGVPFVPVLWTMFFHGKDKLIEQLAMINALTGDASTLDRRTPLEGFVIRRDSRSGFEAYKHKTYVFKVLEGLKKDTSTTPDIEEAEESAESAGE